jgi:hypothetical protein
LPEHWVAPGTHTPVHTPAEQANGQADAVDHWPLALQVSTPLPEHCVEPGVHTPAQTPLAQA